MTTALYRRYRPETFSEVIGQEHVTEPLMQALRSDRVSHAYLFSGPRGCGKTTSARILARCLNCAQGPTDTPCGECPSCLDLARGASGSLDVVEIDAASHGGVDDARELRERATFAPARDRFKIFILDEAHMVTPQGFNALLKIVEEPPEHVKFVFATTEPDKVIGTIRSRTHHYPFRLVGPDTLLRYLEQVCAAEGVPVGSGVLPLVVRAGGGSVRDSLSVLDQLVAGADASGLDYEGAVALLGYTHAALLDDVVDAIAARDGASAFRVVERVVASGHAPRRFVEDLLERLRDLVVIAASGESASAVLRDLPADQLDRMRGQARTLGMSELSRSADLVNDALTEMTGATSPRLHLELLVARLLLPAADDGARGLGARLDRVERELAGGGRVAAADPHPEPEPARRPEPVREPAPEPVREPEPVRPRPGEPAPSRPGRPAPSEPGPTAPSDPGTPGAAPAPSSAESASSVEPRPAARPRPTSEPEAQPSGRPEPSTQPAPSTRPEPSTQPEPTPTPAATARPVPVVDAPPPPGADGPDAETIRRRWPEVLQTLRGLRMATWVLVSDNASVARVADGALVLAFTTPQLAGTFRGGNHADNVRRAVRETLGPDLRVEASADAGEAPTGRAGAAPAAASGPSDASAPSSDAAERPARRTSAPPPGGMSQADAEASWSTVAPPHASTTEARADHLDPAGRPDQRDRPGPVDRGDRPGQVGRADRGDRTTAGTTAASTRPVAPSRGDDAGPPWGEEPPAEEGDDPRERPMPPAAPPVASAAARAARAAVRAPDRSGDHGRPGPTSYGDEGDASPDDPDITTSGLVGAPLVAQMLGGVVIDEVPEDHPS